jgi:acetyltransferase-like isoleucine patch superfamily enzyme
MKNLFFDIAKLKQLGENVIIGKTVRIRNPELVEIGSNVIIDDFTYISGKITIGNYTHIASSCNLQASTGSIRLGAFIGVGSGTKIFAATSNYLIPSFDLPTIPAEFRSGAIIEDVRIGDYTLFGANSVVLNGCNIPEGVAFGANSVISNKKYEKWTLYIGDCKTPFFKRPKQKYLEQVEHLISIEGK